MLQRQIERLKSGLHNYPVIVSTSAEPADDPISELCAVLNVPVFRGSLEDVALRLRNTALTFDLTHIVRVGGDDPLADPDCCMQLVEMNLTANLDFIFASHKRGWPYGTSSDLVSLRALEAIVSETTDSTHREHTLPYLLENGVKFNSAWLLSPEKIRNSNARLSVDFAEDFDIVSKVFTHFDGLSESFSTAEILGFLNENPAVRDRNAYLQSGFTI